MKMCCGIYLTEWMLKGFSKYRSITTGLMILLLGEAQGMECIQRNQVIIFSGSTNSVRELVNYLSHEVQLKTQFGAFFGNCKSQAK
jgi:hypothetical protein